MSPPPGYEPPLPSSGGAPPPPPGKAQQLVARSGFVLYEGGNSVFDESVLVYMAKPSKKMWPDADITDHVGKPLGAVRMQTRRSFQSAGPTTVFDHGGTRILHILRKTSFFNYSYEVTGVSEGAYGGATIGGKELLIEANNERYGSVRGPSFRGLGSSRLEILDQDRNQVGAIRSFRASTSPFVSLNHYVMSVDPSVRGEFRRLLVAAPVIAEFVKRTQQNQA
jgi:hypothetical protein